MPLWITLQVPLPGGEKNERKRGREYECATNRPTGSHTLNRHTHTHGQSGGEGEQRPYLRERRSPLEQGENEGTSNYRAGRER